jgi:uncharacterized protein YxjI
MSLPPLEPIGGGAPPPPPAPPTPSPLTPVGAGAGTAVGAAAAYPPPAPTLTPAAPLPGTPGAAQNPWAMQTPNADRFAHNKFLLNQKLLSLNSKYLIYDEWSQPLFYVDRPLLKLKTQIGVYEDEAKQRKALSVNVESMWSFLNYTFLVNDASGNTIGYLRRKGWLSMLRRTWHVEDAAGRTLAIAQEDSWWKAILRRIFSATDLEIISAMIRTNFILTRPGETEKFGEFIRRFSVTDKYVLDLTGDPQQTLDRRIAVGLAIVLDNAERR